MVTGTRAAILHLPSKAKQIVVRPIDRAGTPCPIDQAHNFAVGAISYGKKHWEIFARCKTQQEAERLADQFRACFK